MMNEPRVIWGSDGFAATSGWSTVYRVSLSGEFTGADEELVVAGTGLSAGAYLDTPPSPVAGQAVVRTETGWELIDDHRGFVVYDKHTRLSSVIEQLGPISDSVTLIPPSSQFDVWDDISNSWVVNKSLMIAQADDRKAQLAAGAEQSIRPLERAKQLGIATTEELAALTEWERYSVLLMRVDTSKAPDIDWPTEPTV